MYITLLTFIILEASSEWVEIIQQQYRKPVRNQIGTKPTEKYSEDITYFNHSVLNQWNDDIHRHPSTDKIKLVNFPTSNINPTTGEAFTIETVDTSESSDEFGFTEEIPFKRIDYGVVERVPNVGSVKKVHVTKTPVRSPVLKPASNNHPTRFQNLHKDEDEITLGSFVLHNTDKTVTPVDTDVAEHKTSYPKPRKRPSTTEVAFTTFDKSTQAPTTTRNAYSTDYSKNKQVKNSFITAKDRDRLPENIRNISSVNHSYNIDKEHKIKPTIGPNNTSNKAPRPLDVKNEFVTKNNNKNIENPESNAKKNNNIQNYKIDSKTDSNNNQEEKLENKKQDNYKMNVKNVMKFMKVVTDTISKNTRRSVGSKMQYLEDLKDTLMSNIADRIDTTWPNDKTKEVSEHRQTRSTGGTARGHVEFPSSETSLMTISFLTFAVFLIKLVLQVIQTYKNKTMMVAPLVVATAGRAAIKKVRHRTSSSP